MRLKLLACAALALVGLTGAFAPVARAADPKSKAPPKKKPAELMMDDKALSKQMQWEDKVMGPDDKRAELDKIARAQAIQKAGAEKAEREKAEREKQAAREAAQPKQPAKKAEIAVPAVPEAKPHEAAKLETAETAAPPAPQMKPADDKFIDKLLKDEGAARKKSTKTDDKELEQLLAVSKDRPGAKAKGKKGDMVDSLLESADKAPAMPAPRAKATLPEWAKPEIAPTPPPPPVAIRPAPKRDDGVIHVVQGAATAPALRPTPVAARVTAPMSPPPGRRQAAAKPASWSDPFADSSSKKVAARDREAARDPFSDAAAPPVSTRRMAPAPMPAARKETAARSSSASGGWNDPFADTAERKSTKRAPAPVSAPKAPKSEPAPRPSGWKDPFSDAVPAAAPAHAAVAMREPARGETTKWEVAARHPAPAHAAAPAESHSRWTILKKRAH